MSITCGFYNAVDDDRLYDASQMSSMFNGIINDGVFESIGTYLAVKATTNMVVAVGKGRAWFNSTWTNNDALYPMTIGRSETILNRIDTIVLEVNANDSVRNNTFKVISGIPATNPVHPTLTNTSKVHQYPLADIYVGAGVTSILQEKITNRVGTSDCPFITGILETLAIDSLIAQWDNEFDNWFNHIRDLFGEDPAGALQTQIDTLNAGKVAKSGDDMSGPLTIETYTTVSTAGNAISLFGQNCYMDTSTNAYKYKNTHSTLGARGIVISWSNHKAYYFDTGNITTTADATFTPTLYKLYHYGDKPTPAEIGANTIAEVDAKIDGLHQAVPITTTGTGSALIATASGVTLVDGRTLRLKLHTGILLGATLNFNSNGAKTILDSKGIPVKPGAIAGSYITVIYNGTSFILQGEGGDTASTALRRYGDNKTVGKMSHFELFMMGYGNPYYGKVM